MRIKGAGKRAAGSSVPKATAVSRSEKVEEIEKAIMLLTAQSRVDILDGIPQTVIVVKGLVDSLATSADNFILATLATCNERVLRRLLEEVSFVGGATERNLEKVWQVLAPGLRDLRATIDQMEVLAKLVCQSYLRMYAEEFFLDGSYANSVFKANITALVAGKSMGITPADATMAP